MPPRIARYIIRRKTLATTNYSILIALNDSFSSRAVVDHLILMPLLRKDCHVSILHFFRKPSASEDLMGKKFTESQPSKMRLVLERARDKLVENGFDPDKIDTELVTDPYLTIADGIIDVFKQRKVNMVMIGRIKMSKAEEFVKGDISVKLVRALKGAAVLVVQTL